MPICSICKRTTKDQADLTRHLANHIKGAPTKRQDSHKTQHAPTRFPPKSQKTQFPSNDLERFEQEESKRTQDFWKSSGIEWDSRTKRLTASDGSFIQVSRSRPNKRITSNEQDMKRIIEYILSESIKSRSVDDIIQAIIFIGYALFSRSLLKTSCQLYIDTMRRLSDFLLKEIILLPQCMERN